MLRIIGIDPGSQRTGYGIIDINRGSPIYVTSGIIRLPKESLAQRLGLIFDGVSQLIEEYQPEHFAIEEVFLARDPRAALKLGQARGAAIVAAVKAHLPVAEYAARSVKKAVVGSGAAEKAQMQMMVTQRLGLLGTPSEDAADALAIALCHWQTSSTQAMLSDEQSSAPSRFARGRNR